MAIRATDLIVVAACCCCWPGAGSLPRPSGAARARPADLYPVATDTRLGGDDNQTRFVMDLSRKIDLRAFTLADPYRVVIDLPQVTFKLPPKTGETGRGLVKAFRFGLVMQGGSRIVLDVAKPVRIDKAFVLDAAEGQPARLVLDLAATDRDTFMRTLALDKPAAARRAAAPRARARAAQQGRSAADRRARSRPWRHRQRHQGRERRDGKGRSCSISRCCCATSSRRPANTAW